MSLAKSKSLQLLEILFVVLFFSSCSSGYTPKPMGYFRIDLHEKEYANSENNVPYSFEYPSNIAKIVPHKKNPLWVDVVYPEYNARIYCSYMPIQDNLYDISEDSREFVYKHAIKADAITQQPFENADTHVYGVLYEIKGNAASSIQFTLTDSTNHYFRAALYFNNKPNNDSIAPVLAYIREDIVRMMETMEWK